MDECACVQMTDNDRDALDRMKASPARFVAFIEWLADQPCEGNGSGRLCRVNSPDDMSWCCPPCRAFICRYGPPEKVSGRPSEERND